MISGMMRDDGMNDAYLCRFCAPDELSNGLSYESSS